MFWRSASNLLVKSPLFSSELITLTSVRILLDRRSAKHLYFRMPLGITENQIPTVAPRTPETADLLGNAILLRSRHVKSIGHAAFRTVPLHTFRGYRRLVGLI